MSSILVGRQPILDREQRAYGYELLYREADMSKADFSDGNRATATVATNSIVGIGLDELVGKQLAFINMTRSWLVQKHYLCLPVGRVVLEVLEDIRCDDEIVEAVKQAAFSGYTIALDDFVYDPALDPLVEAAHIIKVDAGQLTREQLAEHVKILRRPRLKLLAEKVETQEEFLFCRDAGYDLFQGYAFCKPKVVERKSVAPNRMNLIRMLGKLNDPDAGLDDLREIIEHDVGLSYAILRTVNSSIYALPRAIESIRQALVMLGLAKVRTLATVMMMSSIDDKPRELMVTALVRARLCELLSEVLSPDSGTKFFTVGLLSILDALMDMPLEEALAPLNLTEEVRQAILRREGPAGQALSIAVGFEQGRYESVRDLDCDSECIEKYCVEALSWSSQLQSQLDVKPKR